MPLVDSIDKVVSSYFAAACLKPFTYKGRLYKPKPLVVSPQVFRGFTCPAGCGGCCPRFSLDYLPFEERPSYIVGKRMVEVNGKARLVYSDLQDDHSNHHCRNLRLSDGRCGVHGKQPFSCDFELIRFMHAQDEVAVSTRLFGRGWQMLRIDGERGALCGITPADHESVGEVVRKLGRLRGWMEHFGLDHRLAPVIDWAASGPHQKPLIV